MTPISSALATRPRNVDSGGLLPAPGARVRAASGLLARAHTIRAPLAAAVVVREALRAAVQALRSRCDARGAGRLHVRDARALTGASAAQEDRSDCQGTEHGGNESSRLHDGQSARQGEGHRSGVPAHQRAVRAVSAFAILRRSRWRYPATGRYPGRTIFRGSTTESNVRASIQPVRSAASLRLVPSASAACAIAEALS